MLFRSKVSHDLETEGDGRAHGHHRVALVGTLELVGALDGEDGTSGADGVADGDATTVDVEPLVVDTEITGYGEGLRGKRLV